MQSLYQKVKTMFANYHVPAHDFKHVSRVSRLARKIAEAEGYDPQEAEIAGLLHDVGRTVKNPTKPHAHEGVPLAKSLLNSDTDFSEDAKQRILEAIEKHSDKFTKGTLNNIIQDADKLDGLGALGINRAYISHSHLPDYVGNVIIPPAGQYNKFQSIHELITLEMEWYQMLYTDTAKKMGKQRFAFMQQFMEEIKREIEEAS